MKLFKKILASTMAVAVVAGAMFAFTGCDKVDGKEYKVSAVTYTVAVKVDSENETITETKVLTEKEYWMYDYRKIATLEELATKTLTAEQEEEYAAWLEEQEAQRNAETIAFKDGKGKMITIEKNELTGVAMRTEKCFEYVIDGDNLEVRMYGEEPTEIGAEYYVMNSTIDGKTITQNIWSVEEFSEINEGMVIYATLTYSEVK